MLCNPISSSPYFPSSPSGSLAGFVYWRRGWGEKGGSCRTWETVQSTSVRGRKENNKSTTFFLISRPLFHSFYLSFIRILAQLMGRSAAQRSFGNLQRFFFLFPNTERSGAPRSHDGVRLSAPQRAEV